MNDFKPSVAAKPRRKDNGDIMKYGIFKVTGERKLDKLDAFDLVFGDNANPECVELLDSLNEARDAFQKYSADAYTFKSNGGYTAVAAIVYALCSAELSDFCEDEESATIKDYLVIDVYDVTPIEIEV